MRYLLIHNCLLGLLLASAAQAASAPAVLTLSAAVAEVLANNPDVQAAQHRAAAARARIPQARALTDPRFGVEFYNVPADTADVTRANDIEYRVEQQFPFPGKRRTRGRVARFAADAASAVSAARVQDIVLELKQAYWMLYQLDRSLVVNREHRGLLQAITQGAQAWYASGQGTATSPLQAGVELAQLDNELSQLEQAWTTHQAHLKALLRRSDHGDVRLPESPAVPRIRAPLSTLVARAEQQRPELRMVRAVEAQERAGVTAARQTWLPDLTVGLTYKQMPGNTQDVWSGAAMINLPIFWRKNRATVREARENFQAAQADRDSLVQHQVHDVAEAYTGVTAAEQQLARYDRQLVPQANVALQSAHAGYSLRTVDLPTLLSAARLARTVRVARYATHAQLGMAHAVLERLLGQSLEDL